MKAEPAESVSANTTATLLFNICILCILVQGHKSMLPTKEKPEFVFTSPTLTVATRWADLCAAAVGQSWLILAHPPGEDWEQPEVGSVDGLGLGQSHISQSVESSGYAGNSVRELQLMWEPSHPGTGEPGLRISQVWWFEICRKINDNKRTSESKGTADFPSTLLFFLSYEGTFLNYLL